MCTWRCDANARQCGPRERGTWWKTRHPAPGEALRSTLTDPIRESGSLTGLSPQSTRRAAPPRPCCPARDPPCRLPLALATLRSRPASRAASSAAWGPVFRPGVVGVRATARRVTRRKPVPVPVLGRGACAVPCQSEHAREATKRRTRASRQPSPLTALQFALRLHAQTLEGFARQASGNFGRSPGEPLRDGVAWRVGGDAGEIAMAMLMLMPDARHPARRRLQIRHRLRFRPPTPNATPHPGPRSPAA